MTDYHYYITSLETVLSRHIPANRYSFYTRKDSAVCLMEEKWESSFFSKMTMWRISVPDDQDYLFDEVKDACLKMLDILAGNTRDAIVQEFWKEIEESRYVNSAKGNSDRALTENINDLIVDCKMASLLLRIGAKCEAQDAKTLLETLHVLEGLLLPGEENDPTVNKRKGCNTSSTEMEVPIFQKVALTIPEAAKYSNIGINKIDELLRKPNCPFVLFVGTKRLVKRKEFEEFIHTHIVI